MANALCGRMVSESEMAQCRAYRKPPPLFRMAPSLTPYDVTSSPPSPQNGAEDAPTHGGECCHLVNMREVPNYFGRTLLTNVCSSVFKEHHSTTLYILACNK